MAEEAVLEGLAAAFSRVEVSLDQPVGGDGDGCLGDLMLTPGAREEEPEDLLALPGLLAALPDLEREVILPRFYQDLDQYEIAARVGCSQMHVSRLQRRALARCGPSWWNPDLTCFTQPSPGLAGPHEVPRPVVNVDMSLMPPCEHDPTAYGHLVADDDGLEEHQSPDTDQQSPVWVGLATLGKHP